MKWCVAVHGGAGDIPRSIVREPFERGLRTAVIEGADTLRNGGGALEAAIQAVQVLEDCAEFNAGLGSCLTASGKVELEASVMDGRDRRCGAVCGLTRVRNPVALAREVMLHTPHTYLGFDAAESFAECRGFSIVDSWEYFITPRRSEQLVRALAANVIAQDHSALHVPPPQPSLLASLAPDATGTVGAVCCDGNGNVACATSTGGRTAKWDGRIGDTPCIGQGSFACNRSGAVSGTGIGESFQRNASGAQVCFKMEFGESSMKDAVDFVLRERMQKGDGGFIGCTPNAETVVDFTSTGMFWAVHDFNLSEPKVGIWHRPGEDQI